MHINKALQMQELLVEQHLSANTCMDVCFFYILGRENPSLVDLIHWVSRAAEPVDLRLDLIP